MARSILKAYEIEETVFEIRGEKYADSGSGDTHGDKTIQIRRRGPFYYEISFSKTPKRTLLNDGMCWFFHNNRVGVQRASLLYSDRWIRVFRFGKKKRANYLVAF